MDEAIDHQVDPTLLASTSEITRKWSKGWLLEGMKLLSLGTLRSIPRICPSIMGSVVIIASFDYLTVISPFCY